jgi:signal transduction histidine kinase
MSQTERDPLLVPEQLATAEELSTHVRHELRNGLAAIRNAAFYNKRRVAKTALATEDPRVNQFFGIIEDSVAAMGTLLQEGEPHTAPLRGTSRDCPLDAAVRLAVRFLRLPQPPSVELVGDTWPVIQADEAELAVALRHLIENGAEAMPEGGVVRVRCSMQFSRVVLTITDQGPSFSDWQASLKPFATTKPGRLGLGLNVARRIAARYGGELWFRAPSEAEAGLKEEGRAGPHLVVVVAKEQR